LKGTASKFAEILVLLKGHDFKSCPERGRWVSQVADKSCCASGHGFSRKANSAALKGHGFSPCGKNRIRQEFAEAL
jgi:hypothetical protein